MILSMSEVEDISPEDLKVDFPLVIVGARTTWGVADHVTPDDVAAAATAAGYLYDRGSSRLAVVGARDDYNAAALLQAVEGNAQLRLRGVIEETRRRGLELDPHLIGNTDQDWTIGAGARVTQRLIDSGVPFDGVIALKKNPTKEYRQQWDAFAFCPDVRNSHHKITDSPNTNASTKKILPIR